MAELFQFGLGSKEDLNVGYGTFVSDLPDGTSGTLNKIGIHSLADGVINALHAGAVGDGVTNDRAALNTLANTTIDAAGGMIFFGAPKTYRISSNMTFPANVTLWFAKGAKLTIDSGVTVTINGVVLAGLAQIFTGAGTVAFGAEGTREIVPQWFGAIADNSTDNIAAFQAAAAAMSSGMTLRIPVGTYRCVVDSNADIIEIPVELENVTIRGGIGSVLQVAHTSSSTGPGRTMFQVHGPHCVFDGVYVVGSGVVLTNTPADTEQQHGFITAGQRVGDSTGAYFTLRNSYINLAEVYGVELLRTYGAQIHDNRLIGKILEAGDIPSGGLWGLGIGGGIVIQSSSNFSIKNNLITHSITCIGGGSDTGLAAFLDPLDNITSNELRGANIVGNVLTDFKDNAIYFYRGLSGTISSNVMRADPVELGAAPEGIAGFKVRLGSWSVTGNDIQSNYGGVALLGVRDTTVSGNTIRLSALTTTPQHGIYLDNGSGAILGSLENITISGNMIYSALTAVSGTSHGIIVFHNSSNLYFRGLVITGNRLIGAWLNGISLFVGVSSMTLANLDDCRDNVISSNSISLRNPSGTILGTFGIIFTGVYNSIIHGNNVDGAAQIRLAGSVGNKVQNNQFLNITNSTTAVAFPTATVNGSSRSSTGNYVVDNQLSASGSGVAYIVDAACALQAAIRNSAVVSTGITATVFNGQGDTVIATADSIDITLDGTSARWAIGTRMKVIVNSPGATAVTIAARGVAAKTLHHGDVVELVCVTADLWQFASYPLTVSATLDFDLTSVEYEDKTITVAGAVADDPVSLSIPNGAMAANVASFTAWVSASNTVTVRGVRVSGTTPNPASGTFKVYVWKRN